MSGNTREDTVPDRFFNKIEINKETGCWIWKGVSRNGYGQLAVGDTMKYAHRLAWEMNYGEIPKGMNVCHKCDTPLCVNHEHLFLGTQLENVHDCKRKNRAAVGERHGRSLLTEIEVAKIRDMLKLGYTHMFIASRFNVSRQAIGLIKNNKIWCNESGTTCPQ